MLLYLLSLNRWPVLKVTRTLLPTLHILADVLSESFSTEFHAII
jgi:hypothetical protein